MLDGSIGGIFSFLLKAFLNPDPGSNELATCNYLSIIN